ncbi:MAG TPA: hypothetical protein PKY82_17535 [Pyrinomonadaceae bacterium]|nr:hypothetical protein [Pyrinomonadaceae bacterium]
MARSFGLRAKLDFTYILDIEASVGKNAPNHRDDVLLVQFLISVWMAHEKDIQKLAPILQVTPELKIDGRCGEKTNANIRAFETFHQPTVILDGRIDPTNQTFKTNKMFLLNNIFFLAGGLRSDPILEQAKLRIPFPRELMKSLYR